MRILETYFLPRTGIDHPFMIERPRFIKEHKEFEPINMNQVGLTEEY